MSAEPELGLKLRELITTLRETARENLAVDAVAGPVKKEQLRIADLLERLVGQASPEESERERREMIDIAIRY